MSPEEFVAKWANLKNKLNEIAAAQTHFNDICALISHSPPYAGEQSTEDFRFEKPADKAEGGKGRADVFYRGKFIWEYKGYHGNLDKAYQQVQRYREALGNPPLLIVSDLETIRIYTNFTNTISQRTDIKLGELLQADKLNELKMCFAHPDEIERFFKPTRTQEVITQATAKSFISVVDELKAYDKDNTPPEKFARFIVRLLFCLFTEDMGLLPNQLFKQIVEYQTRTEANPEQVLENISTYKHDAKAHFETTLRGLFQTMRDGGAYGFFSVPHFNGDLFDDDFVPSLPGGLAQILLRAARQDWSGVEPSIFGTLFERVIDKGKRAQLGAHYTSRDDIMLIVEPVLMQPLRREWDTVRRQADRDVRKDKLEAAHAALAAFAAKIASTTVLDPACGSGNFLYVALRQLLDLQKEVIVHAERKGLTTIALTASPHQLYGIEINPYAHELAQITIWIGYIQWRTENGFPFVTEPILQPLHQIERKDAILAYDADGNPTDPEWPSTDIIIGNPPFLGGQKLLKELGETYVKDLRKLYKKVPNAADLVSYWFYRSTNQIEKLAVKRAGLIATQTIRSEASRPVLDHIKKIGDIFMAWSDRSWNISGADVRVSIIGFDNGNEKKHYLNNRLVNSINANLTTGLDLTKAILLNENRDRAFMGIIRVGAFDLTQIQAQQMVATANLDSTFNNADVVRPWVIARDITSRPTNRWIIDFGTDTSEEIAVQYSAPFQYLSKHVKSQRQKSKSKRNREEWWLFEGRRSGLRKALSPLSRYLGTPLVSKHRLWVWLPTKTIPDARIITVADDRDLWFGILHSRIHQIWALQLGARHGIGNDPTYNLTTCFGSFPFPWTPGTEPSEEGNEVVAAIAEAARVLVAFRQPWLNPPAEEIGITIGEKKLKRRTLTNMYNALVHYRAARTDGSLRALAFKSGWEKAVRSDFSIAQAEALHDIHSELDEAVLRAYGWPTILTDEQILERLLALNLERAAGQDKTK